MKRIVTLLYAIIFISALMLFAVPVFEKPFAYTQGILMPDFDYSLDATMEYTDHIGIVRIIENQYEYKNRTCVKAQLAETLYGTLPEDVYFYDEYVNLYREGYDYVVFFQDGYPKTRGDYIAVRTYEISLFGKLISREGRYDAVLETAPDLESLREYLKGVE